MKNIELFVNDLILAYNVDMLVTDRFSSTILFDLIVSFSYLVSRLVDEKNEIRYPQLNFREDPYLNFLHNVLRIILLLFGLAVK